MHSFVFLVVFVYFAIGEALDEPFSSQNLEGLWCYNCVDQGANQTWCRQGNDLLKSQEQIRRMTIDQRVVHGAMHGVQRCDRRSLRCLILDIYDAGNGKKSWYRRDCTNGHDLSFNYLDGSRFTFNVPVSRGTNRTTCKLGGSHGLQVCLSICFTDFCNGPQLAVEDNSGTGAGLVGDRPGLWVWVLMMLMLSVLSSSPSASLDENVYIFQIFH